MTEFSDAEFRQRFADAFGAVEPPAGSRDRLAARLARPGAARPARRWNQRTVWLTAAAIAASVVLFAAAVNAIGNGPGHQKVATNSPPRPVRPSVPSSVPAASVPPSSVPRSPSTTVSPPPTTSPVPGGSAGLVPCPIPPADLIMVPTPPPIPATTAVPALISVLPGSQLYGTTEPVSTAPHISMGPTGFSCRVAYGSADGALFVDLTDPTNLHHLIHVIFNPGGEGPNVDLACPYFPVIRPLAGQACPVPPRGETITLIPTGDRSLFVATVRVPPTVRDPSLSGSGDGTDTTLAVVTADSGSSGGAQGLECTLPAGQHSICAESLAFFVATSHVGTRLSPASLSSVVKAVRAT